MEYEKILKREDGTKIKIEVKLFFSVYASDKGKSPWRYAVSKCLPKKRTWVSATENEDYSMSEVIEVEKEYLKTLDPLIVGN